VNAHRRIFRALALLAVVALVTACNGKGSSGGSGGNTPPTAPPQDAAFVCPSSASAAGTVAATSAVRSHEARRATRGAYAPGLIAVVYDRSHFVLSRDGAAAAEAKNGAHVLREHDYPRLNIVARVLAVSPETSDRAMASMRMQHGVKNVSRVGMRYASAITTPYFTNDPYFVGFSPAAAPYYESAALPGQWDKHAIGLEDAWAYSRTNNGSTVVNAGAMGLPGISLAVIDTGEDVTHPELSGTKVIHAGCFITNPTSGVQSTGPFVTDPDGHGTDVSGIAAANINNAVGFVGTGGNVSLLAYRVFPKPDDTCLGAPSGQDQTCGATSVDIASAIDDAVNSGAKVINMSFGGSCPDDGIEGPAVANAIASGVIVVAAAGNDGKNGIDAPACDAGVIAAGASGLADGRRNGTNNDPSGEYVAGYSNYGSGAWGIVAPGGDPNCPSNAQACTDSDNLHWIQNIYTSTPASSSFAGTCAPDYGGASSIVDCRILIAGTSMASPTIAGAAALILSAAGGAYATPAAMRSLLCSTASSIADPKQGCGRLDVYRAMAVAVGDSKPPAAKRRR
jgi:hypothetical protein